MVRWPDADFESSNVAVLGPRVLDEGLPELPDVLTHTMWLPMAYWASTTCAAVLFLHYSKDTEDEFSPGVMFPVFVRDGISWRLASRWISGTGWGHDPITSPDSRGLGRRSIVIGGGLSNEHPEPGEPAVIRHGRVSPEVTEISFVQGGETQRRPIDSHFGAWVVCTEKWEPFTIQATTHQAAS